MVSRLSSGRNGGRYEPYRARLGPEPELRPGLARQRLCELLRLPQRRTIEALERVTRLSPLDPFGHLVKFGFALAHLQSGRYQQAIEWADQALMQKPGFINAMIVRTAACGHLGLQQQGREWIVRLREIAPQLTVGGIRDFLSGFFVPVALAYQVDGLVKAGLAA